MAVLAAIARQLIQLGVHSSFEEVVEASLRDNATYAQYCSVVNKKTGVRRLSLEHAQANNGVVNVQLLQAVVVLSTACPLITAPFQSTAETNPCRVTLLLRSRSKV